MDAANWLDQSWLYIRNNDWVVQIFLVVLVTLTASLIAGRVIEKISERLKGTPTQWDNLVFDSLRGPARWLIWLLGLTFAADILHKTNPAAIFEAIGPIRDVGVIVIITFFLLNLAKGSQRILIEHKNKTGAKDFDQHTVEAISKLLRLSIIITSGLVLLQTLGFSISGVLAFGGIGGIAIGFAAKDLLANFFGGLMIFMDRPFVIGDWIRSDDREIEGHVEHIGWRLTCIRKFNKRPLYVPNAVFSTIAVENPSRMTNRRIYETIGIRYQDVGKMAVIVNDVKQMLLQHEAIDTENTMIVNFDTFADSSINFFVYTFTKTVQWVEYHEIKQDVLLKIADIISGHGAEIAFPTSTLHIDSLPEDYAAERPPV